MTLVSVLAMTMNWNKAIEDIGGFLILIVLYLCVFGNPFRKGGSDE